MTEEFINTKNPVTILQDICIPTNRPAANQINNGEGSSNNFVHGHKLSSILEDQEDPNKLCVKQPKDICTITESRFVSPNKAVVSVLNNEDTTVTPEVAPTTSNKILQKNKKIRKPIAKKQKAKKQYKKKTKDHLLEVCETAVKMKPALRVNKSAQKECMMEFALDMYSNLNAINKFLYNCLDLFPSPPEDEEEQNSS